MQTTENDEQNCSDSALKQCDVNGQWSQTALSSADSTGWHTMTTIVVGFTKTTNELHFIYVQPKHHQTTHCNEDSWPESACSTEKKKKKKLHSTS